MFLYIAVDYKQLRLHGPKPLRVVEDSTAFIIRNDDNSQYLRLHKRIDYPLTYCRQNADGSFTLGYGNKNSIEDEYLTITIDSTGTISIVRDAFATLPIFFASTNDSLIVSNKYSAVINTLSKVSLNRDSLREFLMPMGFRQHVTLVNEVHVLEQHGKLYQSINTQKLEYIKPSIPISISHDPSDFSRILDEHFINFINTRFMGQHIGFETSGGLDSSTLPAYLSQASERQLPMFTIYFPTPSKLKQQSKLAALASYTNYSLYGSNASQKADFFSSDPIVFAPEEPITELYFGPLISMMRSHGIAVISTGSGGDDIFENIVEPEQHYSYGDQERQARRQRKLPPYFTEQFRHAYIESSPSKPPEIMPSLPQSALSESGFLHNLYIENGIWPVSPFISPTLYLYCQNLAVHFRANKNLLRIYHQVRHFPKEIYNHIKSEDYDSYLVQIINSPHFMEKLSEILANSISVKLGYIDPDALIAAYTKVINDPRHAEWYFNILSNLLLERSLQATPNLML